jgi:hypothetical protein
MGRSPHYFDKFLSLHNLLKHVLDPHFLLPNLIVQWLQDPVALLPMHKYILRARCLLQRHRIGPRFRVLTRDVERGRLD